MISWLGKPRKGPVTRVDGVDVCDSRIPPYLVESTCIRGRNLGQAKLIDFGNGGIEVDSDTCSSGKRLLIRIKKKLFFIIHLRRYCPTPGMFGHQSHSLINRLTSS